MLWTLLTSCLIAALIALVTTLARRRIRRGGAAVWLIGVPTATLFAAAAGLGGYLAVTLIAGQPAELTQALGPGVTYRRMVQSEPRAVIHVVEISDPGRRRWLVTPPVATADGPRNVATDALTVADTLHADLLINANFFSPFQDIVVCYRPHAGDLIEAIGTVIAEGVRYGTSKPAWPSFWAGDAGAMGVEAVGVGLPPADAGIAVSGRQYLMKDGRITAVPDGVRYPRTAVALDADRRRMWLIVVDGKQPNYSNGLGLDELANVIAGLGASDAIELDGGGSAVLVARNAAGRADVLSRPCHTQIPRRLRPTGVFLGMKFDEADGARGLHG